MCACLCVRAQNGLNILNIKGGLLLFDRRGGRYAFFYMIIQSPVSKICSRTSKEDKMPTADGNHRHNFSPNLTY